MTLLKNGGFEGFVTANVVSPGMTSIESSRKDMEQNICSWTSNKHNHERSRYHTPAYLRRSNHNFETTSTCAEANTARLEKSSLVALSSQTPTESTRMYLIKHRQVKQRKVCFLCLACYRKYSELTEKGNCNTLITTSPPANTVAVCNMLTPANTVAVCNMLTPANTVAVCNMLTPASTVAVCNMLTPASCPVLRRRESCNMHAHEYADQRLRQDGVFAPSHASVVFVKWVYLRPQTKNVVCVIPLVGYL